MSQLLHVTETFQPAEGFFFADLFVMAGTGAARFLKLGASPAVGVEQTEHLPLRTDGQSRVQEHTQGFAGLGADVAQPLGGRVSDIVQSGGVLWTKDDRRVAGSQALQSAAVVRSQDGFEGDFVIRAKAVGRFAVGPITASLRNGSQG